MSYPFLNQTPIQPPISTPAVPAQAPQMANQSNFNLNQQFSLFPQPTGSVYNLSTASDIGNIPAGMGISVGLCLQENIMYIKALQNGSPMLLAYRLSPIEGQQSAPESSTSAQISPNHIDNTEALIRENKQLENTLRSYDEKFERLEKQLSRVKEKLGGKNEWQI